MRFKAGNFKYIKTLLIKSSLDILETIYLIYLDIATVSYPKRISCHLRFRFRFCRTFAFCQSHRSLFLSTAQCWGCQCRCTTNPKAKRGSQTEAVLPILGRRIGGKTCWETSGNTIICSAKFRGSAADVPKRHQKTQIRDWYCLKNTGWKWQLSLSTLSIFRRMMMILMWRQSQCKAVCSKTGTC